MSWRPAGPAWPWFAAHSGAALIVLIILRSMKERSIHGGWDILWVAIAAGVLALGTALAGALVAAPAHYFLWKNGRFLVLWGMASLAVLFLLSVLMIAQA